ncbi:hypothetical protein BH09PLA1_BH09PLA1_26750 [soil metagenome]
MPARFESGLMLAIMQERNGKRVVAIGMTSLPKN